MLESLTDAQRTEIDALILTGSIIPGIVFIMRACRIRLPEARNLFKARYRQLRAAQEAEFACDDAKYWSCFSEDIVEAMAKEW